MKVDSKVFFCFVATLKVFTERILDVCFYHSSMPTAKKVIFLPCFSQLNNSINEALNNVGINPSENRNE